MIDTLKNIRQSFKATGICEPISNVMYLYFFLMYTTLPDEEISRLMGLAIHYNAEYVVKNVQHDIQQIETIIRLAKCYTEEGYYKESDEGPNHDQLMDSLLSSAYIGLESLPSQQRMRLGLSTILKGPELRKTAIANRAIPWDDVIGKKPKKSGDEPEIPDRPKAAYNGVFTAGEQETIKMLDECLDIRSGNVKRLPEVFYLSFF